MPLHEDGYIAAHREMLPDGVEVLDEVGDEPVPQLSEAGVARLVFVTGLVTVVAVVSMIVRGTMALPPVPPPDPSDFPVASSTSVMPEQPPALEADDPAEPLQISLAGDPKYLTGGLASFPVRVCVSPGSAGVAGERVRVQLSGWRLRAAYYGDVSSPVSVGAAPEFPEQALLGAGACATGNVTFPFVPEDGPHVIAYVSTRFIWSWYLG
ncbi:MAG TPA: hypothetical protein VLS51_06935 [Propionibacteriaceae bacterium]|nr:hypothetical protein [Propionibacteriaceae bacterium]